MNIILAGQITATTADLLNSTRLQTFEAAGILTIQLAADVCVVGTNAFTTTLQLPGGGVPYEDMPVPANGTVGLLDSRNMFQASYAVDKGGHAVLSFTETGTAVVSYRVIFNPRARTVG